VGLKSFCKRIDQDRSGPLRFCAVKKQTEVGCLLPRIGSMTIKPRMSRNKTITDEGLQLLARLHRLRQERAAFSKRVRALVGSPGPAKGVNLRESLL
jgi:hypothetical protein